MSKLEKQKEKAKSLEARDPKGAAEAWLQSRSVVIGEIRIRLLDYYVYLCI